MPRKSIERPISVTALEPKDLFTLPEVAYRMSTSLWAVRTLCREGRLKYVKTAGQSWLVSPGAIQEFIKKQETEAAKLVPSQFCQR